MHYSAIFAGFKFLSIEVTGGNLLDSSHVITKRFLLSSQSKHIGCGKGFG